MAQKGRAEEELDLALAAELQSALLPKECPAKCANHIAAAKNRMCHSVGGDFYDFIRINSDQTALIIGDVAGHGVRAAMVMAKIMGWMRSEPRNLARPPQLIQKLNRMLIDLGERTGSVMPCSIFYMVIDEPTGICLFINAGHPRPLLCNAKEGTCQMLGYHEILLGVEESQIREDCHTLKSGQRLVMYTDGVIDAFGPDDQRFGGERLRHVVSQWASASPAECVEKVFAALDDFRGDYNQTDDETIVILDRI